MGVELIIGRAKELGVTLSVDGGRLRYFPKSQTPDDLVDALRLHKEEVLEYLAKESQDLAPEPTAELLGWASELAEQDIVLDVPITFVEAPLRKLTTAEVSSHAAKYLRSISSARLQQKTGGWPPWTPQWWKAREDEAIGSLGSMRVAVQVQTEGEGIS